MQGLAVKTNKIGKNRGGGGGGQPTTYCLCTFQSPYMKISFDILLESIKFLKVVSIGFS